MGFRHSALAATLLSSMIAATACSRAEAPDVDAHQAAANQATPTFVGCVAQTGQPDVFLLTVARGSNREADAPAGSVVPPVSGAVQDATPGAGRANANADTPVGTGGNPSRDGAPQPRVGDRAASPTAAPGAGATPAQQLETYRLSGGGGVDLASHVGHTLEVKGTIRELPGTDQRMGTQQLMGELQVSTARVVSEQCAVKDTKNCEAR